MMWFPAIHNLAVVSNAYLFLDTKSYYPDQSIHLWTDHLRIPLDQGFLDPSTCVERLIFLAAETNGNRIIGDPSLVTTYQEAVSFFAPHGCVIIFEDMPNWERTHAEPTNPLLCIQGDSELTDCRKPKRDMISHFESTNLPPNFPNVHVIDLIQDACPYADCYAYNGTFPIYRDPHHLTEPLVNMMWPDFAKKIEEHPCVVDWLNFSD
jgi:hypothetical protein